MIWSTGLTKSLFNQISSRKKLIVSSIVVPVVSVSLINIIQSKRTYSPNNIIMTNNTVNNKHGFIAPANTVPDWTWTPKQILDETKSYIEKTNKYYNSISEIESPSIENLIIPYMNYENKMGLLINQLTFLQHVSADKKIRDASLEATRLLEDHDILTSLRWEIWEQFEKVWETVQNDDDFLKNHQFETYKFIEKIHKDSLRNGLKSERNYQLKYIKGKISADALTFSSNLGEQNEYVSFTKEELDGVSETVMDQFEKFIDPKTNEKKYKVTFKYPDIFPVLKTAKNPKTRKIAFLGDQNKVPENEKLLCNVLKLRKELANTLGYSTYANYNLDIKMAKNQETVLKFLNDLKEKLKPLAEKEIKILKDLKKKECEELGIPYDGHYYIWDHRYYDNKYLKDNFNVDIEKISEYYPLESTIDGMLKIYETVLNLKFIEETDPLAKNVWHPDVKQLSVWNMDDRANPAFVGWIYFDLYPRDGKYGHAANFGIASSYITEENKRSYPVTALVCNFSKPTKNKPALLKHSEITTFFHELGHGIHDLVGQNKAARFNGPGSVPWDFVEAPSQMLEFWTWNKNELLSLSKHYKTGEKIPEDLLDSLISTKHVNGALFALRQLHFGLFDMTVHTTKDIENLDLLKLWNESREEICLVENGENFTKGYNSFGHIISDSYSAGYYGYMWAEVFAADMYHTKFAPNPLDVSVGIKYRDLILAKGGLYEINDNLLEFLGREPSNKPFLKELGL
ncbi:metalloendopeptidase NDAI_0A00180 [Naumovozyma dairenensis CBS 421]|uniref:Peptidase M3A/M3B catalytic domain-containing protein n=1 Tax=Naumovozyma dairenensis (strain ATCC 10597 / BCRC 20456 / CBS 421 / NBRC 0211 / NRRL Y-12639) TaxID=1071378 RepID=G0W5G4_NAUDC|nr:hypothetical protein NDAI_0A00180 [Naumovozyma dairenensis CBS 421]CCD22178.1 hypothetical protein NDAI_0A00180 [Naumovozyma dairenensis CBS 421]